MTWLITSLLLFWAISFVKRTIDRGKARSGRPRPRSLRDSDWPRAGDAPGPENGPKRSLSPRDVLGVSSRATRAEIALAYRKLVVQYHPDKVATSAPEIQELAARRLREINAAYAALTKES